jgi:hypothetical protein
VVPLGVRPTGPGGRTWRARRVGLGVGGTRGGGGTHALFFPPPSASPGDLARLQDVGSVLRRAGLPAVQQCVTEGGVCSVALGYECLAYAPPPSAARAMRAASPSSPLSQAQTLAPWSAPQFGRWSTACAHSTVAWGAVWNDHVLGSVGRCAAPLGPAARRGCLRGCSARADHGARGGLVLCGSRPREARAAMPRWAARLPPASSSSSSSSRTGAPRALSNLSPSPAASRLPVLCPAGSGRSRAWPSGGVAAGTTSRPTRP